ncbi:MAG: aldo/keto reductase [Planctomycetota bacterium]
MTDSEAAGAGELPRVTIGRTGLEVSRYGLGGFHQLEVSSEVVRRVVDAFLAEGGTYIETARGYGDGASEDKLGRALDGRRDRVVLASKTSAATADDARRDLETSLETLHTDHLEFYFFHGPDHEKLDRITARDGALVGLLAAKDEGLIDGLGLSSHTLDVYLDAFDRIPLDLILVWCNYLDNLNFPVIPDRILPEARERGIAVTAMKPLADGFLHRSVESAIRFVLAEADVAVCGTNAVEHVVEVARAVRKGPADAAEREAILRDAPELGTYVCRRCGDCPPELTDTFRLEGECDRQMLDYRPHDPADYALRDRLSHWFSYSDAARAGFAGAGHDPEALLAAAARVDCPYGIDVVRKARLAIAKLTDGPVRRV